MSAQREPLIRQGDTPRRVWDCQVGFAGKLPAGSDLPMRQAVARAFRELTGREPDFIFSGWGGSLDESRRAVIEDRLPDPNVIVNECRKRLDDTLEAMHAAQVVADHGL